MAREVVHRRRIDLVEVIQNAGLVAAEEAVRFRVANVPRVTREIDARVERHEVPRRFASGFHDPI